MPALVVIALILAPAAALMSLPAAVGASLGWRHALTLGALAIVCFAPLVLALHVARLDAPAFVRWRGNVIAAGVSTVLGLAALEAGVRLLGADPGGPPPTFRETPYRTPRSPAPRLVWELAPNQSWKTIYPSNERGYFGPDNAVTYRTNAQGFRGDDFVAERRPGVLRVALLGDSFAFGLGVREEHTVARRLQEALAVRCPVEVLNFGVLGYTTEQEEALLRKRVLVFHPDLVVVWYFLNDPEIEGTLRFLGGDDPPGFFPVARKVSALARLVGTRLDAGLSLRALIRTYTQAYRTDDPRWKTVEDVLARMGRISRERQLPIVLFVHPVLVQLDNRYPFAAVHRQVLEASARAGIPAFDLMEAFRGRRAEDLWVHRCDQHPNDIGQALAARYAAEKLSPFLPHCAAADH
jgi:hypothetical protein